MSNSAPEIELLRAAGDPFAHVKIDDSVKPQMLAAILATQREALDARSRSVPRPPKRRRWLMDLTAVMSLALLCGILIASRLKPDDKAAKQVTRPVLSVVIPASPARRTQDSPWLTRGRSERNGPAFKDPDKSTKKSGRTSAAGRTSSPPRTGAMAATPREDPVAGTRGTDAGPTKRHASPEPSTESQASSAQEPPRGDVSPLGERRTVIRDASEPATVASNSDAVASPRTGSRAAVGIDENPALALPPDPDTDSHDGPSPFRRD